MFYLVLHHISALADSRKDMIDWMARGYRAYDGSYVNFDTMKAAINRLRENTCPHPEAGVKQFCDHVVALCGFSLRWACASPFVIARACVFVGSFGHPTALLNGC